MLGFVRTFVGLRCTASFLTVLFFSGAAYAQPGPAAPLPSPRGELVASTYLPPGVELTPRAAYRVQLVSELDGLLDAKEVLRTENRYAGPITLIGLGGALTFVGALFRFGQLTSEGDWTRRDENLARAAFFGGLGTVVGGVVWMTRRHHRRSVHDVAIRGLRLRIRDLDRSAVYGGVGGVELRLSVHPNSFALLGRY